MSTAQNPYFKVVKPLANGTKIAGRRGALNDVFPAPEPQVRFQLLEGLIVQTDSAGVPVSASTGGGQSGSTKPAGSDPQ